MAKGLAVFIIVYLILVFIGGCNSAESGFVHSEPVKVSLDTESNEIAPVVHEPNDVKPVEAESKGKKTVSATPFDDKFAIDRKFKDHTDQTGAVLNFINNYISKEDINFLETGSCTINNLTFDWSINDAS